MENEQKLSRQAKALWGKLGAKGTSQWLPLWVHLADTAEMAERLWDSWLPLHTRIEIARGISAAAAASQEEQLAFARQIAVFMAAVHDLGKGSPVFVVKAEKAGYGDIVDEITGQGLTISAMNSAQARELPHALVGECILERQGLDRSFAVVVGGHHGKPPNTAEAVEYAAILSTFTGIGRGAWHEVQQELLHFALIISGLRELPLGTLSIPAQVLLSGFLIMADWLASGDEYFPLLSRDYPYRTVPSSAMRAKQAWAAYHLPCFGAFSTDCPWAELYAQRFERTARPMQEAVLHTALTVRQPGLFIIEAPMGEGKTEAALAAAEVLARRCKLSGVYFALPTQATSDGIFPRIVDWIKQLHPGESRSIFLAHGKAGFNEDYAGIRLHSNIYNDEADACGRGHWQKCSEAVIVNDWTRGRKKGLLADFVVGTIDQVLLSGLKAKHLSLRHLGLANKVIILDECHAYDTYMSSYLDLVVRWLGAYQVPVIVLSATLPPYRRQKLLQAYREAGSEAGSSKRRAYISRKKCHAQSEPPAKVCTELLASGGSSGDPYPLISYTDGPEVKENMPPPSGRQLTVRTELLADDRLVTYLSDLLSEGGCAGIIRNTVGQAQATARLLADVFGSDCVRLLHSRFLACDRVYKERELRALLGPGEDQRPQKLIVVGTQVMEQSLDVDFDVMLTDICPMDLLLQRMGRLHRHRRQRPRPARLYEARCFVMGVAGAADFEPGSLKVYGRYLLLKTRAFLENEIHLPEDIPRLVREAYEDGYEQEMAARLTAKFQLADARQLCEEARAEYQSLREQKEQKAKTFQIKRPDKQKKSLVDWLNAAQQEDVSGKRGEATVRDSMDSVEVLVVMQKQDGQLYTLPWLEDYPSVRIENAVDDALAKAIAGCRVSLPSYFTAKWHIDDVIQELEEVVLRYHLDEWYVSHWLDGELFLVLDEAGKMELLDKTILYDADYGLSIKEQEG